MHWILVVGILTNHYPSFERCNAERLGLIEAGNKVGICRDVTLIKPKQPSKAFMEGFKQEMSKPEVIEGQDI